MLRIKICEVCGREFATEGKHKICSTECRQIRRRESCRKAMAVYRALNKEEKSVPVDIMGQNYLSIEEVQRLTEGTGLSYGYYVGLKWLKGERV